MLEEGDEEGLVAAVASAGDVDNYPEEDWACGVGFVGVLLVNYGEDGVEMLEEADD